jgi:hypothetical protein
MTFFMLKIIQINRELMQRQQEQCILHKIDLEIIEKQTWKKNARSLRIFEDILIDFSGSLMFCLRDYDEAAILEVL